MARSRLWNSTVVPRRTSAIASTISNGNDVVDPNATRKGQRQNTHSMLQQNNESHSHRSGCDGRMIGQPLRSVASSSLSSPGPLVLRTPNTCTATTPRAITGHVRHARSHEHAFAPQCNDCGGSPSP